MSLEPEKPYFVYILWTDTGRRFYTGVTEDIPHRLTQHNRGESKWTKRYAGTWTLTWHQKFDSLSEARKFENLLKKQKGGAGFWKMTGLDPADFGKSTGS
jgi:putative endonuclease